MAAPRRKKDPDAVRLRLMESAVELAEREGLSGVTVQAVADAAGVTKGGLFHHFPTKQALVQGLFAHIIERLDTQIDAHIAADQEPTGSFTRAYVETTLAGKVFGFSTEWSALFISMTIEPSVRVLWSDWMRSRLKRHDETDGAKVFETIRFAADGAWLEHLAQDGEIDVSVIRDRLVKATFEGLAVPAASNDS